jgi:hypothetical protein
MKKLPSARIRGSEVIAALDVEKSTTMDRLLASRPELGPAVDWMKENGCAPHRVVNAVLAKLVERGRTLPREERVKYAAKVVLGEFLARWVKKHRGSKVSDLQKDPEVNKKEVRPLELAMVAIGNATVFRRTLSRLARVKTVQRHGGDLGNADDFSAFVMSYAPVLAHRFLSHFDPTVKNAPAKAVKYLEVAAVSHYLHHGVVVERDTAGLARHMRKSKRLSRRTKLAAKLVYLPSLLTEKERSHLRKRYGLTGSLVMRRRVKDVADVLGYPTPNTLSRKLYRLRAWVDRQKQVMEGPDGEVQY